eukprot:bmy_22658T0
MPNVPSTQPAIMKPTEEHPAYTQIAKVTLGSLGYSDDAKEINLEISKFDSLAEKTIGHLFLTIFLIIVSLDVTQILGFWSVREIHAVTLFLNIFGCLAWFCVDPPRGVDFGLSILWFLLFTPCSFVCWYRPLYGAFRKNQKW